MLGGCLTLLTGTVVSLSGVETTTAAIFLAGTAVAGVGFGIAMLGTFRTVSALAPPGLRARLIAAYFIASYLSFSVPIVAARVAITHFGLHRTSLVYGATIAVLAAVATGGLVLRRRPPTPAPGLAAVLTRPRAPTRSKISGQ